VIELPSFEGRGVNKQGVNLRDLDIPADLDEPEARRVWLAPREMDATEARRLERVAQHHRTLRYAETLFARRPWRDVIAARGAPRPSTRKDRRAPPIRAAPVAREVQGRPGGVVDPARRSCRIEQVSGGPLPTARRASDHPPRGGARTTPIGVIQSCDES
jgi:hypothetical protein